MRRSEPTRCANSGCEQVQQLRVQKPDLFDYLVGAEHKASRNLKIDCLGRLKVNYKLEPRRLLHRNVGRLGAAEDPDYNLRPQTVHVSKSWTVRQKGACLRCFRPLKNCRQS